MSEESARMEIVDGPETVSQVAALHANIVMAHRFYRACLVAVAEQHPGFPGADLPPVYDAVSSNVAHAGAVGSAMKRALQTYARTRYGARGETWWEEHLDPRADRLRELLPQMDRLARQGAQVNYGIAASRRTDLDVFAARVRELLA